MPTRRAAAPSHTDDQVVTDLLDDALGRVQELSARLWRIRRAHSETRPWWRTRARCGTCGVIYPCPTLTAAGPGADSARRIGEA